MPKTDAQRERAKRARKRRNERSVEDAVTSLQAGGPITGTMIAQAIQVRHRLPQGADPFAVRQHPNHAGVIASLVEHVRRGALQQATLTVQTKLVPFGESVAAKDYALLISVMGLRNTSREVSAFLDLLRPLLQNAKSPTMQYFACFTRWVLLEHSAERSANLQRAKEVPPHVLERGGFCVTQLAMQKGPGPLDLELQGSLPESSIIQRGDIVFLSFTDTHEIDLVSGLDAEVTDLLQDNSGILVKVSGASPEGLQKRLAKGTACRLDKLSNRITFNRALEALRLLATIGGTGSFGPIKEIITVGFSSCDPHSRTPRGQQNFAGVEVGTPARETELCNELVAPMPPSSFNSQIWHSVNSSQKVALMNGLQRRFSLIQGPPGSGKTHTAVKLVQLWIEAQYRPVLCTADSNVAVDNLLAGCISAGLKAVRIGRPEAIREELEPHSLGNMARDRLAGSSGDSAADAQAMWGAESSILKGVDVVCATCSGAKSAVLDALEFPCVLVDEAAQATEPTTLIALVRPGLRQAVFVGDHRQLPPVIVCGEVERAGLGRPLFERLVSRGVAPVMLDVQFRMHPAIALYPAEQFYAASLRTGVVGAERKPPAGFKWPVPGVPLALMPITGEEQSEGSSFLNMTEAHVVAKVVEQLLEQGDVRIEQIGVVSPYAAQVRLLRQMLGGRRTGAGNFTAARVLQGAFTGEMARTAGVEVGSIDGFQGREKEVIIVSTVRANAAGKVGFLSDPRRLNVMLTRARRGLVVCGELATLLSDMQCWAPWVCWAQRCGLVVGYPAEDAAAQSALKSLGAATAEALLGDVSELAGACSSSVVSLKRSAFAAGFHAP